MSAMLLGCGACRSPLRLDGSRQVNRWMNGGQPRTTEHSCRRPVKGPEPWPYPADPALTISALFPCRLRYSPSFISSPA